jgi:hypothetical protein
LAFLEKLDASSEVRQQRPGMDDTPIGGIDFAVLPFSENALETFIRAEDGQRPTHLHKPLRLDRLESGRWHPPIDAGQGRIGSHRRFTERRKGYWKNITDRVNKSHLSSKERSERPMTLPFPHPPDQSMQLTASGQT